MKKSLCASLVAASFVFAASAYSADGVYISANVGMALAEDADMGIEGVPFELTTEFDSGLAATGAIGYRMANLRFEAEVGYQENDLDQWSAFGVGLPLNGDMNATSFLANAYYDFTNSSPFTPFITGGLGMARVEINDLYMPGSGLAPASDDDTVFAWQVGAGVSYAVNQNFDIDLKYRYFMTDDLEFSDGVYVDSPTSHNIYFGMRYTF